MVDAVKAGANDYIVKPLSEEVLTKRLSIMAQRLSGAAQSRLIHKVEARPIVRGGMASEVPSDKKPSVLVSTRRVLMF